MANSVDPDQTALMRSLIRPYTARLHNMRIEILFIISRRVDHD